MSDLISREALLDYIDSTNEIKDWCLNRYSADWIYSFVKSAPSVDAAPMKRGRWIFKWDSEKDPKRLFIRIVCSECDLHTGMKSNFCPNCGARMDGRGEADA